MYYIALLSDLMGVCVSFVWLAENQPGNLHINPRC